MAVDQRILCRNCSKKITPRLWHKYRGSLLKPKIHHLCPYCGKIQNKSGGGLSLSGWSLVIFFILSFFSFIIMLPSESEQKEQIGNHEKAQRESVANRENTIKINRLAMLEKSQSKAIQLIEDLENAINEMKISMTKGYYPHLQKQVNDNLSRIKINQEKLDEMNKEIASLNR